MKIKTRFFDEIEIDKQHILTFPEGIPAFENLNEFIILNVDENSNLRCLQSIENSQVCLMIISPWDYFKDYEIELSDNEIHDIQIENEQDVVIYNVITVREDKITANMAAPIVINAIKNIGKQIILSNVNYKVRQEISCLYYHEK